MKARKIKNMEFRIMERGGKIIAKKIGTRKCVPEHCMVLKFKKACEAKGYEWIEAFAHNICNVCYACKNSKYIAKREKYLYMRTKPERRENWNMRP